MRCALAFAIVLAVSARRHSSDEEDDEPESSSSSPLLPSRRAMEMVGVQFVDALIKRGQMEMAKGAFRTQLEVLEKVHPDQYKKYKKLSVDELAADAVLQQAEMAKLQPKTGNPFVDMLNENGIPIASSLKGIEQAIKTQRDMETQDPSESIAKAVLEKFQQQILPGLVANMIAGRNPFKVPQAARRPQLPPDEIRRQALMAQQKLGGNQDPFFGSSGGGGAEMQQIRRRPAQQQQQQQQQMQEEEVTSESEDESPRSLSSRLRSSPRLRALLQNPDVAAAVYERLRDAPMGQFETSSRRFHDAPLEHGRALAERDREEFKQMEQVSKLDGKAAIVLGLHDLFGEGDDNDEEPEYQRTNSIRRAPLSLNSAFVKQLAENDEIKKALGALAFRVNDVEKYLEPKPLMLNPKPQPGYFVPRKLPTRPRKMLPLLIAMDPNEAKEVRRKESSLKESTMKRSRTITNLQNNPNIAALFMDGDLEETLSGRQLLTDEQRGRTYNKVIKAYPRLFGSKTHHPMDGQVSQVIEERPVPPLVWTPKGRHTRLRWTGATEKEIPGLGGRFIVPSLDPTMPALNTAYSTQGRAREEWDSTFKIPNTWSAGDEAGFSMSSKSQRFIGGNGGVDMPALGLRQR